MVDVIRSWKITILANDIYIIKIFSITEEEVDKVHPSNVNDIRLFAVKLNREELIKLVSGDKADLRFKPHVMEYSTIVSSQIIDNIWLMYKSFNNRKFVFEDVNKFVDEIMATLVLE